MKGREEAVAVAYDLFDDRRALKFNGFIHILVTMTRISRTSGPPGTRPSGASRPDRWRLQDAKARFSELVRRARSEGPQLVTVHGRSEVVVIAAEEFNRLKGEATGEVLIAALQASPLEKVSIEPGRDAMPVRDVQL